MVSIAVMAGGALVNALAFSGTNFLFGQMGDHGKVEMKRHNIAMEALSKARDEYGKKRRERLDYINQTFQQQKHASQTFSDLGAAMQQYAEVTGRSLPSLGDPPKLSDFYTPSEQQKDGEIAFIIGGMVIVGGLAYKYRNLL